MRRTGNVKITEKLGPTSATSEALQGLSESATTRLDFESRVVVLAEDFDGIDVVVLSGESAAGNYAVRWVSTVVDVAIDVEKQTIFRNVIDASRVARLQPKS